MTKPQLAPWKKVITNLDSILKSRDIILPTKVHLVKAIVFPAWDHKEGWVLKNWCFRIVVLEKTLESPLDSNEIKPANPTGNQRWIFIGRTDAEAEAPIFWPSDAKSWLIKKDHEDGKYQGQEKKGWTEDQMFGWHHQLNGHKFEQTRGDSEGLGSLACCSPWGGKEPDTT